MEGDMEELIKDGDSSEINIIDIFPLLVINTLTSVPQHLLRTSSQTKLIQKYKINPESNTDKKKNQNGPQMKYKKSEDKLIEFYNVYEYTGLYPRLVSIIMEKCAYEICRTRLSKVNPQRPRERRMNTISEKNPKPSPFERILIVLYWIKFAPPVTQLARMYGVSYSYMWRELHHLIPILSSKIMVVDKFDERFLVLFPSPIGNEEEGIFLVNGAIDCTSHFRNRPHPGQIDWYRGDKKRHFYAAQVLTHLSGLICHFQFAMGHNNDQGIYNMSLRHSIDENVMLLVDDGYCNSKCTMRANHFKSLALQKQQRDMRCVVEVSIGYVQTFEVARKQFELEPEFQEMVLSICYNLTQLKLMISPLRQKYLPQAVIDILYELVPSVLDLSREDFIARIKNCLNNTL